MKIVTNEQMMQLDELAVSKYGIPGVVLMENAGTNIVFEVMAMNPSKQRVHLFCGMGNNGGDGFVAARHLSNNGFPVTVYVVGKLSDLKGDSYLNYQVIKKMQLNIEIISDGGGINKMEKNIRPTDMIVDALIGTGLNREVTGIYGEVIDSINRNPAIVLSVDIPSGVDANNGRVLGRAIEADKTVTFALPKIGNILFPGAKYQGELLIKKISIPDGVLDDLQIQTNLITRADVMPMLKTRERDTHKGTYGKANLIAGSFGMTGAAILAARACLRSGAGLLKLYIPESLNTIITTSIPEVVTVPLTEMRKGVIAINQLDRIVEDAKKATVTAVGPGCGDTSELLELIRRLLRDLEIPIILDADGLNALSRDIDLLNRKKSTVIITPHPGEMSRLTGLGIKEINEEPMRVAKEFAKEFDVICILKGSRTVIATPSGELFINASGNPGMATAGSGDVLTGILTSLIAQGIQPIEASMLAVYLHGVSGDLMAEKRGEYSLIASDIVEGLTTTMREMSLEKRRQSTAGRF